MMLKPALNCVESIAAIVCNDLYKRLKMPKDWRCQHNSLTSLSIIGPNLISNLLDKNQPEYVCLLTIYCTNEHARLRIVHPYLLVNYSDGDYKYCEPTFPVPLLKTVRQLTRTWQTMIKSV